MGVSRPMAPAGPMRMGEARRWVPAGLAGSSRSPNLVISCPDPNSHVVCLTDWLVNRTLRNFLLSFNDKHWAEVSRNLCLLGVLCLKHLAANPDFVWGNYELAELIDYIQRENRWPEELMPETRRRGQRWVAPWSAVDTVARPVVREQPPASPPKPLHRQRASKHEAGRCARSVSATDSRRRRPSTAGSCSTTSRRPVPTQEPHWDPEPGSPAGLRASEAAPIASPYHYSQCGDLLSPRPSSGEVPPDELPVRSLFAGTPALAFASHAIISAEPRARVHASSSQRQRCDLENRRASSSAAVAPQQRRMSRAPSAPPVQGKGRRAVTHHSEQHVPSQASFVQQVPDQQVGGESGDVDYQQTFQTEDHGATRLHSRPVLADHALQKCSELCEPRLARGGWCADVPFHDDEEYSRLAVEEQRRELSSAQPRNHSCGRSAASTTAPIAASESHSFCESPSSTVSSGLSLGSPIVGGRGSAMR